MWRGFRHSIEIASIVAFTAVLLPIRAAAQSQEVEIEIAGPWSYASDPYDETRVVVIAPQLAQHAFDVLSGSDVSIVTGALQPPPGFYKLDVPNFDRRTNCQWATPPPMASGPYPVSVPLSKLKNTLQSGSVFAISLPIPCRYESYVAARMKIDADPITTGTPEKSYPTWMVLHYSLSAAPNPIQTVLQGYQGTVYTSSQIKFLLPATHPSSTAARALSFVLYDNGGAGEDSVCDQHSADSFDGVLKTLWGQTFLNRVFPELYMTNLSVGVPQRQTHRYNLSCSSKNLDDSGMVTVSTEPVLQKIDELRKQLSKSDYGTAITQTLPSIQDGLNSYWNGRIPQAIRADLDSARDAIAEAQERKACSILDSNAVLGITVHLMTVGRIDCNAAQVSINGAVP